MNGRVFERALAGQGDAQLVDGDGVLGVAKRIALKKLAGVLGVLAADGPAHFEDVADLQAGEADDELLLGVVHLVISADVAEVDVRRRDRHRLAGRLVNPCLVQCHPLVRRGVGDAAELAEPLDSPCGH
ncbi:MAG: hypothetical protein U0736_07225 [Gemmataceae bacterium]